MYALCVLKSHRYNSELGASKTKLLQIHTIEYRQSQNWCFVDKLKQMYALCVLKSHRYNSELGASKNKITSDPYYRRIGNAKIKN